MVFMMWYLMQVDVNRLEEVALSAPPDRVLVVGVMAIGILLMVSLIGGMYVLFKLANRFLVMYAANRERELKTQEAVSSSLKALGEHDAIMNKLEQQQLDLLSKHQDSIDEVGADVKKAIEGVENLTDKLDELPDAIQQKLKPIVSGMDGLSRLIEDTKKAQDEQVERMIETNERHMATLQSSVNVIQTSFSTVVAALATAPPINGVKIDKEGV
jgi:predicted PurR-regulated permease PerM